MRVRLLSRQVFSHFGGQRSRSPGTRKRLTLPTLVSDIAVFVVHCDLRLQSRDARINAMWSWVDRAFRIRGEGLRVSPYGGICVLQACWCSCFLVCHSNISGMAEQICAKFTGKMCLVPRSDEFEGWGQRSGHQGQKMQCALVWPRPPAYDWYALTANNIKQQRTGPFHRCWGCISGGLCAVYVYKTSLAVVL